MKIKPVVCGIVAIGPDNVIGYEGGMPWHSRQDFYHFKTTTMSYPCVFGRNTYENLPKKPLPGRLNIVCGTQFENEYKDSVFYANSMAAAMRAGAGFNKIFICGGAKLYKYALDKDLIDVMYITQISDDDLSAKIRFAPNEYTRFPVSWREFFTNPKWTSEKIMYPTDVLPPEKSNIKSEFFAFSRVR